MVKIDGPQVVKLVNSARCITPEGDLKDDDGRLDPVAQTEKDESFREMVLNGLTWTVIPSSVEDRCPEIPELFQQSFNAKNNVAAKSTELEAACLTATHARMQRESGIRAVVTIGRRITKADEKINALSQLLVEKRYLSRMRFTGPWESKESLHCA